ncbi:MAG: hypothetical protein IPO92_08400 [Saprospiraceae bacterium]|nr:hypothetical protein [Saprospiraceae bacterium]
MLVDNIYTSITTDDTLVDIKFVHSDPLFKDGAEHINTGNRGSSAMPLIYRPKINTGFNTGYNQYEIYKIKLENFKFFEQNRPISDLYFSQLGNQQNLTVGALFSRNFKNGLTVSLNYNRISQQGFYAKQDTKSTNFGFGLRYQSPTNTYNAFLIYLRNANNETNNGGIANIEDLINSEFSSNITTRLNAATTRHQEQNIAFIQYLRLNKNKGAQWLIYLRNDLEYRPSYYKFSDNVIDSLSNTVYKNDTLDTRGIRRFLSIDHIKNTFFINGERSAGIQGRIGISLDHFSIINYSTPSSRTDITLQFDGKIPIIKGLEMHTNAKLGLLKNVGNFDLMGKVLFKVSKTAELYGGIRLFSSEQILFADLDIPKLKFQAGLAQTVINLPVFWNKSGIPEQSLNVLSSTYLRLKQNIKVWKLHLDNQVHYQLFSEKLYALPTVYSTHQFYYTGALFNKVMEVNIGLDFRLIGSYQGAAYQPLAGEFILSQNESSSSLPFYPASNFYIAAKVSAFRALIVMENFSQYFNKDANLDIVNHPQNSHKFRFGFQWLLKD